MAFTMRSKPASAPLPREAAPAADPATAGTTDWRQRLEGWGPPALIFLLALLPRAIQPVSRAMLWYTRSIRFWDAVLSGDLASTNIRHHPGVTVMWLAGAGLRAFARLRGLTSRHLAGREWTETGVIADAVGAGVVPLALTIALCIVLCYFLIRRLAGRRVALAAGVLLALDPFYISRSQVLHLDALLATLMLVSALFLLNHLRSERHGDLLFSGAFGGLALLTKSPALFLVPYVALAAGVHGLAGLDRESLAPGALLRLLGVTLRTVALWALVAGVLFVAVWPAMWVEPLEVVAGMVRGIGQKVSEAHHNPLFFAGRIVEPRESPGALFYLVGLAWKTTLVTLPMMVVGMALAVVRWRTDRASSVIMLLLVAYAFFFITQMCLGARESPRYILPAFLVLDVVAAFGVVWTARASGRWARAPGWLPGAVVGAMLVVQAAMTLPAHPYYGTLYNPLVGGARTAQHMLPLQEEGEGIDLAAQALNALPDARNTLVGVDRNVAALFGRTFLGTPTALDDPAAAYRVYGINMVVRQLHADEWGPLYVVDRRRDPVFEAAFGGVPYVRVYRGEAQALEEAGPVYSMGHRLGEHIQLERVRLSTDVVLPGGEVVVRPYWTSDGQVDRCYTVFCHLLSADGELLGQHDSLPLRGERRTTSWEPGEVFEDRYKIEVDRGAPPGPYQLSLGMYDSETLERLPVVTEAGERLVNDRIVVGIVRVANIEW